MDRHIGELLDNRYEILEEIGSGGMSVVYKARCHRLNRFVAVKILRKDLSQDADLRRRFHDESQAVAMLSHPNIVSVYDVSRSSELEYIVMELIDGITLKQYMQKHNNQLNWRESLHFITQIVKGLGHAHSRGIIHRDIKPHNIMVLRDGSVKVADFGIARQMGNQSTLTQEALGSVHYISPEQAKGSNIDARSDLYSAGVVLYEMITGRLPFEGDTPVAVAIQHIHAIPLTPKEIDPTLPDALELITMKAMAPNPNGRYASADAMLADLEEFRKNPTICFDYDRKDFVNSEDSATSATQVISTGTMTGKKVRKERAPIIEDEEYDDRPAPPWALIIAIITILAFIGGLVYFLYNTFLSPLLLTDYQDYTIPSLVGTVYEDVKDDTELLGEFELVIEDTITDASVAGTILTQTPSKNATVRDPSAIINITVSSGPETITMIDILGQDYQRATVDLRNQGLDVVYPPETAYSDTVPVNCIISYEPPVNTILAPGDTVSFVVSLGEETLQVPLISFVDMTLTDAQNKITLLNLSSGTVDKQFSDTVPEGVVMDQYPKAGDSVTEGSLVNLIVSKGPEQPPETEPEPIYSKDISVNIPYTDGSVVSVQATLGAASVYYADVDTAMEAVVNFTVTGTGTQTLCIYFDGVLTSSQEIVFGE